MLLVEDHADTAKAISLLLKTGGHDVTMASTGRDAERLCESTSFDVMICDIMLPDGEGWDLAGHCLERGIPAIAFTGLGTWQDIAHSSKAGFVAHVVKPVDFEVLEKTLDEVSRSRRAPSK